MVVESGTAASRLIFSTLLIALTLLAYFVPYYDWDLVAYTGAAIALRERDVKTIQSEAYAALRRELPEDDYQEIVSGSAFRRDVAGNPDHFSQQLRFYQIRPLYIRLLAFFRTAGLGYVQATRLLSALAFLLLGLVLLRWARRYIGEWRAAIGVPLLLITPAIFTGARTGSPDALSALVVTLGTYWLFERKRLLLGASLLLISLFLRSDNVIFVFFLLAWMALAKNRPLRPMLAGVLAVLSLAIVVAINRVEHGYGWQVLMQNTSSPIVNPAEVTPTFTAADYLSAVHEMVDEGRESSVLVFPFLAALALLSHRLTREWRQLVVIVLLSSAAHIVLFPHIEDRYFVAGSAIIGVAVLTGLLSPPDVSRDAVV